jgi:hypothetical protein
MEPYPFVLVLVVVLVLESLGPDRRSMTSGRSQDDSLLVPTNPETNPEGMKGLSLGF